MYDCASDEPYLIDGDLGQRVSELASPYSSRRSGTLPFMAIELLDDPPPPHLYRHDLESFFYALTWMLVTDHSGWDKITSVPHMRREKLSFLFVTPNLRQIRQAKFHPEFEPLRDTWFEALYLQFADGLIESQKAARGGSFGSFDYQTQGGYVTYEKFLEVCSV